MHLQGHRHPPASRLEAPAGGVPSSHRLQWGGNGARMLWATSWRCTGLKTGMLATRVSLVFCFLFGRRRACTNPGWPVRGFVVGRVRAERAGGGLLLLRIHRQAQRRGAPPVFPPPRGKQPSAQPATASSSLGASPRARACSTRRAARGGAEVSADMRRPGTDGSSGTCSPHAGTSVRRRPPGCALLRARHLAMSRAGQSMQQI